MLRRLIPLAAALLTLASTEAAVAQEYCVTCTGPDATYRCLIGNEATGAARSSRGQFLCITELAKAGGHASCSAARGQATPCPGETRTVMFTLGDPEASPLETGTPQPMPASPPPSAAAPPAPAMAPGTSQPLAPVAVPPEPQPAQGPPQQTVDAPDGSEPQPQHNPNAVEKLADQTGKAVSDTGKAVGHAVKKSWDCVTSFFGDC